LVSRNEHTTDLARADLRHVEDDDGGDETDTKTCNETTSDDETETFGLSDLKNDTNDVDEATRDDGPLATEVVCNVTSDDSTEEGTSGEDRNDEGGVGTGEGVDIGALDLVNEELGASDTWKMICQ
jgi:hypothetical protein